jgi:hypothetical protein
MRIGQVPGSIAYRQPLIKPAIIAGLSHVSGDYRSLWRDRSGPTARSGGCAVPVA